MISLIVHSPNLREEIRFPASYEELQLTLWKLGLVLIHMEDKWAVPSGTRGTVDYVDDAGQIHMKWDNGRTLAIVPQVDKFRRLTQQELLDEQGTVPIQEMSSNMA